MSNYKHFQTKGNLTLLLGYSNYLDIIKSLIHSQLRRCRGQSVMCIDEEAKVQNKRSDDTKPIVLQERENGKSKGHSSMIVRMSRPIRSVGRAIRVTCAGTRIIERSSRVCAACVGS
jgi:hypothetical protein